MSVLHRQIVVHGHFYQPPREEPWLELVPREPSAAPDHDWNARITRQCYAPLGHARVLDARGQLRRVVNAYEWCSFDVGPTLCRWFDEHAPAVRDRMIEGDRRSRERLGYGNAVAMPYHHLILPLASRRDKITEVRWGIRDFRERFGRDPEGMWLPETAMDEESLDVLVEEGIRFTILAPHQVANAPAFGRPGRWRAAGGRELAIFTYDGVLAHAAAFGDLLNDAGTWMERVASRPLARDGGVTIDTLATDGETFGHHHRFGDLALAAFIDFVPAHQAELANFAALLAKYPPTHDVQLVEPTSWSCPHGVERWRRDCGCRMEPATSQQWRAPLRAGLDALATGVQAVIDRDWPTDAGDFHAARDRAGGELADIDALPSNARLLLEGAWHSLAMFTSCAWFFDDLARLEPKIVLRHAARALECLPADDARALQAALLATLAEAKANDLHDGDGASLWHDDVLVLADGPMRLAAAVAAVRELAPEALHDAVVPTHEWHLDGDDVVTRHRRTGVEQRWLVAPRIAGVVAIEAVVSGADGAARRTVPIALYPAPVRALLAEIARPMILDAAFGDAERALLRDGSLDPEEMRLLALAGAWRLVERDGIDADIVVHAALDLFDLDDADMPPITQAEALEHLTRLPASAARDALALRFHIALDVA